MKNRIIIYIIFLFVLIAVVLIFRTNNITEQKQIQNTEAPSSITKNIISYFSFVFHDKQAQDISILGIAVAGQSVTLLEKSSSHYCTAVTTSSKDAGWAYPIDLTALDKRQQCGAAELYSVAVVGTVAKDYKSISYEQISNDSLITEIDLKIRNSSILDSLKTKAQGLIAGDQYFPLTDLKPTLHSLNIPNQAILLATYSVTRNSHVQKGPRVIVINDNYYPLTGWCSYPDFRVFALDGKYYLESGSYCCGCGITIQELFVIKNDSVALVWDDDSYSN